jgi:hypothetical protein
MTNPDPDKTPVYDFDDVMISLQVIERDFYDTGERIDLDTLMEEFGYYE